MDRLRAVVRLHRLGHGPKRVARMPKLSSMTERAYRRITKEFVRYEFWIPRPDPSAHATRDIGHPLSRAGVLVQSHGSGATRDAMAGDIEPGNPW